MRLRAHLNALVIGAMTPLVVVVVAAGVVAVQQERATIERDAIGRTRAAMTAVDAELRGVLSGIAALASSHELEREDLRGFYEQSRRVRASQPHWLTVSLITAAKVQVFDAVLPFGQPPPLEDSASLDSALHGRRLTIGSVAPGSATGVPGVWIRAPIVRDGAVRYVLSVRVSLDLFSDVMRAQRMPDDWIIVLVDRDRRFIARIPSRPVGASISDSFREALDQAPEGFFRGRTVEGFPTYTPYVTSELSGWVLGIAVPAATIDAGALRLAVILAAGLALALALAWFLAWTMARRIAGPIGALAASAEAGHGGPEVIGPGAIDEIVELHNVLRTAADAVRERTEALETAHVLTQQVQTITDAMLVDLPLGALLREVLFRVHAALGADTAAILLRSQADGHLHVKASIGLEEEVEQDLTIPIGHGFAGTVAQERRPIVWDDVDAIRLASPVLAASGVRSLAGVPLLAEGALLGVLHVGTLAPRRFSDNDVKLLELAAERIAFGVERATRHDLERRHREAAEAASRAKDEFLAMLGHELRNPLGAIVSAVGVLKAAGADGRAPEQARAVIERQARHLSRLVDDLLDVSRVTTGKVAVERRPVELGELVSRAMDEWRLAGRFSRHRVSTATVPVWVAGDPTRLEQVLDNLVGNALKYTPPGGAVTVRVMHEGGAAILEVADTGAGVPAHLIGRIFDLFVQADPALDRAQGGLGLGLTLVKALVELHGGTVQARSDGPGMGSTFGVRLPGIAAPDGRPAVEAVPPDPGSSRRILVVEDNDDAREMLRVALTLAGHEVHEAADGPTGVAMATEIHPDVAVIDVGLPGLDGYEVARRIRGSDSGRLLPLIALTGYGQPGDERVALQAGFDTHLTKPVTAERLLDVIRRVTGTRGTS